MGVTVKVLIPAKSVEDIQTTQYTAKNVTTIVDKITATNYSSAAVAVSISIVTNGTIASNDNLIVKTKVLQAAETYLFPELTGFALEPGGFISTLASEPDSVNIRASGREITS